MKQEENTYYADQLAKVDPKATIYPPTIKVFANGNGENTNNISLNAESARVLVDWLQSNFLKEEKPEGTTLKEEAYTSLVKKVQLGILNSNPDFGLGERGEAWDEAERLVKEWIVQHSINLLEP